ncbi:MAG TPA: acetoacetate decarboxylase family protein [Pseudonocardia sp.]|jgi:acetoacetate decarboxylase|nr:acetoacetate decarboxylase family protein [Pseudonocardia sp.]
MTATTTATSTPTSANGSAATAALPYTVPAMSPLYTPPPYHYSDGWSQLIIFRSDPDVIGQYVPAPLVADPAGTMTMMISRFFASGFGVYHEATLCALATFDGQVVNHPLYLALDSDIALGGGREIWGWPKKIGHIELAVRDGVVTTTVRRGGIELVRGAVEVGPLVSPDALAGASMDFVNLKLVPSVTNGKPPEVAQLIKTSLSDFTAKRVYRGAATLSFGASPTDRFNQFPVQEIVDAFYYNSDFTLGDGEVVHNYLAG